jgi:hypothetical protein
MELQDRLRGVPPSAVPAAPPGRWTYSPHDTESYDHVEDNPFLTVRNNPLSTFSIDVDTASYALVRRFIEQQRTLPPKGAVRIEELINYFTYDYPPPRGRQPFSVNVEIAGCPWNAEHRLARIGLKGREITRERAPACNLVFLVDVSGSMNMPNKLPLVKQSLELLARQLRGRIPSPWWYMRAAPGSCFPPHPARTGARSSARLSGSAPVVPRMAARGFAGPTRRRNAASSNAA